MTSYSELNSNNLCMWISLCYVCALEQQLCLLSHVVVHGVCKRLHGMSCDQSILAQKCMCISLCVVCVNVCTSVW